ncbi:hypothetical protein CBS115988_5228 [Aspergillus niger]|nr:hypothetical protein CBS11232_3137 [Aspergillus niger]KAI2875607.1 hypothetical protein CBS115988_5228 [Aspergillus niger]KAI2892776.1 hypothetical protein CBS11852_5557 [Aspergillus niger]
MATCQPSTETLSGTEFYVRTLQLYKILRKILSEVYEPWEDERAPDQSERPKSENELAQTLLSLDEELLAFESNLPVALQWRDAQQPADVAGPFRRESSLLRGRFLHLRILLLRPTLVKFCRNGFPPRQAGGYPRYQQVLSKSRISVDFSISCSTSCVETAIELSHLMNDISTTELASVWWYNVFYAFTAGVVLILAQASPAMTSKFSQPVLENAWKSCCDCLENMNPYSNTARNCATNLRKTLSQVLDGQGQESRVLANKPVPQSTGQYLGRDTSLPRAPNYLSTLAGSEVGDDSTQGALDTQFSEALDSLWSGDDGVDTLFVGKDFLTLLCLLSSSKKQSSVNSFAQSNMTKPNRQYDLNQIGYVARDSVTYRDGKRVSSRGWEIMYQHMRGTFLDYCLNIRQKFSEEVIRDAYVSLRGEPYIGWRLDGFTVEEACDDDYKVVSHVTEVCSGRSLTVRSKFIVGADGSHSLVRRLAGIPFEGDHTNFRWVRIDGRFKTDMPEADIGFASIESKSHGNVLWVQLDHGVKRIGCAMTPEMLARYGDKLTLEDAKVEAVKSMEPFSLEFETIDWWTLYGINQRVAECFYNNDCVLLAGDACHTHSSGTAQGMNTGVHDAVNLAWKLGGIVKGWYNDDVLRSYDTERRPVAQHLIDLDKDFSATISGTVPDRYKDLSLSSNELFAKVFDDTIDFCIGLGIHYNESTINKTSLTTAISAGWRAPDALVYAPGSRLPVRLFHLMPNVGAWSILLLAGHPEKTRQSLIRAVEMVKQLSESLPREMIRSLTVVAQSPAGGDQRFSIPTIGRLYYDPEGSAHAAYTVSDSNGAVVVVRPDGILGYATQLDEASNVIKYFAGFITR